MSTEPKRQTASLQNQIEELALRHSEGTAHIATLRSKNRPHEALTLMGYRMEVLLDALNSLRFLYKNEAKIRALFEGAPEQEPADVEEPAQLPPPPPPPAAPPPAAPKPPGAFMMVNGVWVDEMGDEIKE